MGILITQSLDHCFRVTLPLPVMLTKSSTSSKSGHKFDWTKNGNSSFSVMVYLSIK